MFPIEKPPCVKKHIPFRKLHMSPTKNRLDGAASAPLFELVDDAERLESGAPLLRWSEAPGRPVDEDGLKMWVEKYPLVMTNSLLLKMTIEIVDFPINSMVIFQFAMLVHQRVVFLGKTTNCGMASCVTCHKESGALSSECQDGLANGYNIVLRHTIPLVGPWVWTASAIHRQGESVGYRWLVSGSWHMISLKNRIHSTFLPND